MNVRIILLSLFTLSLFAFYSDVTWSDEIPDTPQGNSEPRRSPTESELDRLIKEKEKVTSSGPNPRGPMRRNPEAFDEMERQAIDPNTPPRYHGGKKAVDFIRRIKEWEINQRIKEEVRRQADEREAQRDAQAEKEAREKAQRTGGDAEYDPHPPTEATTPPAESPTQPIPPIIPEVPEMGPNTPDYGDGRLASNSSPSASAFVAFDALQQGRTRMLTSKAAATAGLDGAPQSRNMGSGVMIVDKPQEADGYKSGPECDH